MTKDEAKRVCVQPAQDLRSFPEAADGRPMPPMGDELMTAGLNCEDARFVAIQLAQNGFMLVAAAQPAQEAEVEMADAALTEWEDNNVLVPPHISGLALCAEYMRRTADFNRSWVDGRNGPRAGDYIGNSPGYIARRIQAAELFDRMAGAALDALRALPAAQDGAEIEALHQSLGSITVPDFMHGDNLAIALCTAYDNPDQDTDDETGWTPDAIAGQEAILDAIRAHYDPMLRSLTAERDALKAEVERLMRLIRLAHPVMRECGWQLAPACAAEGSDGILEAACAEIEEEFGDMLRTDGGEAGQ